MVDRIGKKGGEREGGGGVGEDVGNSPFLSIHPLPAPTP